MRMKVPATDPVLGGGFQMHPGGEVDIRCTYTALAVLPAHTPQPCTAMPKLRIVTVRISGGRSLARPFHDARRFPSTRWFPVPGATRTTLRFGICPSFKDPFLSRRAKP